MVETGISRCPSRSDMEAVPSMYLLHGRKLTDASALDVRGGCTEKLKLGVKAVGVALAAARPAVSRLLPALLPPANSSLIIRFSSAVSVAVPFSAKKLARVELMSAGDGCCARLPFLSSSIVARPGVSTND